MMTHIWKRGLPLLLVLLFSTGTWAGDTCIFTVTADSVPPNVLLLLDNGAEMEFLNWHRDYADRIQHAPTTCADANKVAIYDVPGRLPDLMPHLLHNPATITLQDKDPVGEAHLTVTLTQGTLDSSDDVTFSASAESSSLPAKTDLPDGTYTGANVLVSDAAQGRLNITITGPSGDSSFPATVLLTGDIKSSPFIKRDPTPAATPLGPFDVADGRGAYCNTNGYSIFVTGGKPYLRGIEADLSVGSVNVSEFMADNLTVPALHLLWFDEYTIAGVRQPGYGTGWSTIEGKWSVGTNLKGETSGATATVAGIVVPAATSSWSTSEIDPGTGLLVTKAHSYKKFAAIIRQTSTTAFTANYQENIYTVTGGSNGGTPHNLHSRVMRTALTLPSITPSTTADPLTGIKDAGSNSEILRLNRNYLNWLSFKHRYDADGAPVAGSNYSGPGGADLPDKRRFYFAKLAIRDATKLTGNKAAFGLNSFGSTSVGASNNQPLGFVVNTIHEDPNQNVLDPNFVNSINNMGTVTYSPLAEGLADLGGIYSGKSVSGYVSDYYCQKHFAIVVTAGFSSKDLNPSSQGEPGTLSDYDLDSKDAYLDSSNVRIGSGALSVKDYTNTIQNYTIPLRTGGSTYLDDVAYYMHTTDMIPYKPGFQNVLTYTVGTGTSEESRRLLINASNNGNGNYNLADETNPEYGRYHFDAQDPQDLSAQLMAALNSILSRTATFTAPVVPVTRTTSGDLIYLAFFKPLSNDQFWEGNITKFGLGAGNIILDKNGNPATWPNGAMRDEAEPYWATKLWGDPSAPNHMPHATRKIYTFTGSSRDLTHSSNAFVTSNALLTEAILGTPQKTNSAHPAVTPRTLLMNYIRGADSFDNNNNGSIGETRRIIHADALHGEPVIVPYGSPTSQRRMVYFSANDGMLHAVHDENGKEAWGFIPPDHLHRLRLLTEGVQHPYYIDSSPKVFLDDKNGDGFIDHTTGEQAILVCGYRKGGKGYFALDVSNPDSPRLAWRMSDRDPGWSGIVHFTTSVTNWTNVVSGSIWASGTHADGTWYYLYASTYYDELTSGMTIPYIWGTNLRAGQTIDLEIYRYYADGTCSYNNMAPMVDCWNAVIPPPVTATISRIEQLGMPDSTGSLQVVYSMGQTWSEPVFAKVKTATNLYSDADKCSPTAAPGSIKFKECLAAYPDKWKQTVIFGGGYDPRSNAMWWSGMGSFVYFADVFTGAYIDQVWTGIGSIPSAVTVIDADNNGFIDKVYVGDMGGNIWRIGQFNHYYNENNGLLVEDDPNTIDINESIPPFPKTNEYVYSWTAERLFSAGCDEMGGSCTNYIDDDGDLRVDESRRFFYPPDVALEKGFDLLLIGSGDRESACNQKTRNRLYVIKDNHQLVNQTETNLANTTAGTTPDLYGTHNGFYLVLPDGDKALAEGTLFFKVFYITVFSPSTTDPCTPGGVSYLYSFGYKTGAAGADMDGDGTADVATMIGGGIGSKPVVILRDGEKTGLLISVGSTNPDDTVGSTTGAGVIQTEPASPDFNFNMLWWREMF